MLYCLVEVKSLKGYRMRFTPAERGFMDTYRDQVYVVTDVLQASTLLDAGNDQG
jgi:hypothetical protein